MANDYTQTATFYAANQVSGTGYLVFRDLFDFISPTLKPYHTLDFGCGTGRSTRLLQGQGFQVTGLDISAAMIAQAKARDHTASYLLLEDHRLPFKNNHFHLVVSTLVLFEIATLRHMERILTEINRVLHRDGIAVFVTGSEAMYSHPWLSIFPLTTKKTFRSGEIVKIKLNDNLILEDYFWTNSDYRQVFKRTGFVCQKTHHPLGRTGEYDWVSEYHHPPYVLYVLAKH